MIEIGGNVQIGGNTQIGNIAVDLTRYYITNTTELQLITEDGQLLIE
jgi:hypothetical protein